jgi:hypothetical protein
MPLLWADKAGELPTTEMHHAILGYRMKKELKIKFGKSWNVQ